MKNKKVISRAKRHKHIRRSMVGTPERPRLSVRRSLQNLYAQIVDDTKANTLFFGSTQDKDIKQKFTYGGNIKAAEYFGQIFAQKAKAKGIVKVVFDRGGYLYHGRVKVFAEALRKGGLEF